MGTMLDSRAKSIICVHTFVIHGVTSASYSKKDILIQFKRYLEYIFALRGAVSKETNSYEKSSTKYYGPRQCRWNPLSTTEIIEPRSNIKNPIDNEQNQKYFDFQNFCPTKFRNKLL